MLCGARVRDCAGLLSVSPALITYHPSRPRMGRRYGHRMTMRDQAGAIPKPGTAKYFATFGPLRYVTGDTSLRTRLDHGRLDAEVRIGEAFEAKSGDVEVGAASESQVGNDLSYLGRQHEAVAGVSDRS